MSTTTPTATSPPATDGRVMQLDVLRAVAVILVFGRHLPPFDGGVLARAWGRCGWMGVDLFFVLSGYLVSGLLFSEYQRHGHLRIGRFLVRRGFKIYPPFYTLLAATLVAIAAGVKTLSSTRGLIGEFLFLQNYLGFVWGHTWSLAVEEHFYLFLALLAAVLVRARAGTPDPFRPLVPIFVVTAVTCLAFRILRTRPAPFYTHEHVFATHLRIDSLFAGVVLSYLTHYFRPTMRAFVGRFRGPILLVAAACVLPPVFIELDHPFIHTVGFTLLYVGFAALLLLAVSSGVRDLNPVGRLLARIGVFSYSIYLWHMPVFEACTHALRGQNFWLRAACTATTSIVIGIVMAKLVEMPVLRIRNRWFPSQSRQAPADAGLTAGPPSPSSPPSSAAVPHRPVEPVVPVH